MKKLVICGDSFAKGLGCHDLKTEPYGSIVAAALGLELVNIAKGHRAAAKIALKKIKQNKWNNE